MAKDDIKEEKMTPDNAPEDASKEGKRRHPTSMSMIEPRFRNIYKTFYKETYFTPTHLDLKTKELIAIGVSLAAKCEGCLQGHIKKALEIGVTKAEISDAIVIAVGIAAAGMVDMSDHAAIKLDLHHFE
jgi:AhpD family alkylhydroperoxidase